MFCLPNYFGHLLSLIRKYYAEHLANYEATYEDYMKKYKSFPLAIELEKLKAASAERGKELAVIDNENTRLKEEIASKESRVVLKCC